MKFCLRYQFLDGRISSILEFPSKYLPVGRAKQKSKDTFFHIIGTLNNPIGPVVTSGSVIYIYRIDWIVSRFNR